MTTTPPPSPEAEALPTLPVVATSGWIQVVREHDPTKLQWDDEPAVEPQAPAEAVIVALRAEVERLTMQVENLSAEGRLACEIAERLTSEVAELRKDAQRYRTLRHSLSGTAGCSHTAMPVVTAPFNSMLTYTLASFDAVLDEIFSARAALLGDGGTL